jgi:hypothetical protein
MDGTIFSTSVYRNNSLLLLMTSIYEPTIGRFHMKTNPYDPLYPCFWQETTYLKIIFQLILLYGMIPPI